MNRDELDELRDVKDALEQAIDECGWMFSATEVILGYVTLKSSKKAQVTLKLEADKNEWISD